MEKKTNKQIILIYQENACIWYKSSIFSHITDIKSQEASVNSNIKNILIIHINRRAI